MRRYLVAAFIGVLVLVLADAVILSSEWFQTALYNRTIRQNLEALNQPPAGGDGLNVVLVGSGGPIANEDRSSPCLAVFAGRTGFLVDVGPGAWKKISRFHLPAAQIGFVLLTHFHSDHSGDLGEVSMQTWAAGRSRPLKVYGPPGVEQVAAGFRAAYEPDARYRDPALRRSDHARDSRPNRIRSGRPGCRPGRNVLQPGRA